jgi:hypothetical protein
MDERAKLLLESLRGQEAPPGDEPVSYDVKSLLECSRERVYTAEGRTLVDAARQKNGSDGGQTS